MLQEGVQVGQDLLIHLRIVGREGGDSGYFSERPLLVVVVIDLGAEGVDVESPIFCYFSEESKSGAADDVYVSLGESWPYIVRPAS